MRKWKCLLLIMVFVLTITGAAYADPADLIAWDTSYCISSDDPNAADPADRIDEMASGYTNYGDGDYGRLTIDDVDNDVITCSIGNAYPGYQANIETNIINVTNDAVTITGIGFADGFEPPDCVEVSLRDGSGTVLLDSSGTVHSGFSIDGNTRTGVRLVTSVNDSAAQLSEFTFAIVLSAEQEESGGNNNNNNNQTHGSGGEVHGESIVIPNYFPSEPQPFTPQQETAEPVNVPIQMPELPYTGGDILLIIGTGAALGGLGIIFKRRK